MREIICKNKHLYIFTDFFHVVEGDIRGVGAKLTKYLSCSISPNDS